MVEKNASRIKGIQSWYLFVRLSFDHLRTYEYMYIVRTIYLTRYCRCAGAVAYSFQNVRTRRRCGKTFGSYHHEQHILRGRVPRIADGFVESV